jgi:periplasmic protein TonB
LKLQLFSFLKTIDITRMQLPQLQQLKDMSSQNKITILVVLLHVLLIAEFRFGAEHHRSGNTIGETVTANLLDPNPQLEKSKVPQTKLQTIVTEKTKSTITPTTNKSISTSPVSPSQEAQNSIPPSSLGGSSSGEPKSVSMSQAQCSVPEPFYPGLSRRMGEEGKAMVRLYISETGSIEKANLAQSSGIQRLDQSALDAALKVKCRPFIEFGKPIKVTAIQPYIFRLE